MSRSSLAEVNLASDGFSENTLEGRDGMVVDGVMESDSIENMIVTTAKHSGTMPLL
jgi:hypothetical protein